MAGGGCTFLEGGLGVIPSGGNDVGGCRGRTPRPKKRILAILISHFGLSTHLI